MGTDGTDDVTVLVNSSPDKLMGLNLSFTNGFSSVSNAVLCAKASMLLQVSCYLCFIQLNSLIKIFTRNLREISF